MAEMKPKKCSTQVNPQGFSCPFKLKKENILLKGKKMCFVERIL